MEGLVRYVGVKDNEVYYRVYESSLKSSVTYQNENGEFPTEFEKLPDGIKQLFTVKEVHKQLGINITV